MSAELNRKRSFRRTRKPGGFALNPGENKSSWRPEQGPGMRLDMSNTLPGYCCDAWRGLEVDPKSLAFNYTRRYRRVPGLRNQSPSPPVTLLVAFLRLPGGAWLQLYLNSALDASVVHQLGRYCLRRSFESSNMREPDSWSPRGSLGAHAEWLSRPTTKEKSCVECQLSARLRGQRAT